MKDFMLKLTKIQMLSPKSELYIGSLDLNKLEKILFKYNEIDLVDIFWSAFSQIGGYYE